MTDFYGSIPVFTGFADVTDAARYMPLPEGWWVGLTDVVSSTQAIAEGRYKSVNMAGAAAIAAMVNTLKGMDFPFAFGGDGVAFAVAPEHEAWARQALGETAAFARDELGHTLRTALVPIADIRAAGRDVRVARYGASPHVSYAMFAGGGIGWAEAALKRGDYAVPPAEAGARPDLSGLSCRWNEIDAARGVILSLILVPAGGEDTPLFRALIRDVLELASDPATAGRPVAQVGDLTVKWPPAGFDLEVRASRPRARSMWLQRLRAFLSTAFQVSLFRFSIPVGGFNPDRYRQELIDNADFRKYEDGLRLTLDCTAELADRLEVRLDEAEAAGIARYGAYRQKAAILTCLVPVASRADHVHFIDGAAGGYATAAKSLKSKM